MKMLSEAMKNSEKKMSQRIDELEAKVKILEIANKRN